MPSGKQLLKYMNELYVEIDKKQKQNANMRLHTDNEFQQAKIKDLKGKFNITMFTTDVRGRKAFAAEQKIRELKKRISKIKEIFDQSKSEIIATTIIKRSAHNMNNVISEKYRLSPNNIETKSMPSEQFRTNYNFDIIKKSKKIADRLHKYDKKFIQERKNSYVNH